MPGGCGHSPEEKGQPSELDQVLYSCETPFVHLTYAGFVFVLRRARGFMRVRRHSANGGLQGSGETMEALVLGVSEGDLKCLLTGAVQRCHLPSCPLNAFSSPVTKPEASSHNQPFSTILTDTPVKGSLGVLPTIHISE